MGSLPQGSSPCSSLSLLLHLVCSLSGPGSSLRAPSPRKQWCFFPLFSFSLSLSQAIPMMATPVYPPPPLFLSLSLYALCWVICPLVVAGISSWHHMWSNLCSHLSPRASLPPSLRRPHTQQTPSSHTSHMIKHQAGPLRIYPGEQGEAKPCCPEQYYKQQLSENIRSVKVVFTFQYSVVASFVFRWLSNVSYRLHCIASVSLLTWFGQCRIPRLQQHFPLCDGWL